MVYFKIFPAKAFLVIAILVTDIQTYEIHGQLPDLTTLIEFLQKVLQPYANSTLVEAPMFRSDSTPSIEKVIEKKINELMPFLQDHDNEKNEDSDEVENENNSNIKLDGDDETTIVEFHPPEGENNNTNVLKTDIEKYKKMRKKIKKALLKESVSEKTQNIVTKTLDSMIAELLENKCKWNNSANQVVGAQKRKTTLIARKWNKQWEEFKKQFLRGARSGDNVPVAGMKLYKFFEQFHSFLSHIVDDTEKASDRYKIVCQFIERKETNKGTNERNFRKGKKGTCEGFKICSGELRVFLNDFYNSLNNTAVSTFRNYASMYVRDVNTAKSEERESVVMTVNEIGDLAEHKVEEIFIEQTLALKIDKMKVIENNIKALKHYIQKTINKVTNSIKNDIGPDLRPLGSKLQHSISQDLTVNLDLDLGNYKEDLKGRICEKFASCNGKFNRRQNDNAGVMLGNYNRNSVYVKVQMNLDDEIKGKLIKRLGRQTEEGTTIENYKSKQKNKKDKLRKKKDKKISTVGMELIDPDSVRKNLDINVTRTTHQISTTLSVTNTKNNNVPATLTTQFSTVSVEGNDDVNKIQKI